MQQVTHIHKFIANHHNSPVIKTSNFTKDDIHRLQEKIFHSSLKGIKGDCKKGKIALFKSKQAMQHSVGFVVDSYNALHFREDNCTHWTPNTYGMLRSTPNYIEGDTISGHSEDKLNQLNTFVVDVDYKNANERDLHVQDVVKASDLSNQVKPTCILFSDKGFQIYYVLDNPKFISKKSGKLPVLDTAKLISQNIRLKLKNDLGTNVDVSCNNFGIFRMPRVDNLVMLSSSLTNFHEAINFSKKFSKLYPKRTKVHYQQRQVDQAWYKKVLTFRHISPISGGTARHNALFTLALANFSSNVSKEDAYQEISNFNNRLYYPMSTKDVDIIMRDAYKGKYSGAQISYISELIKTWGTVDDVKLIPKSIGVWYKFAKTREERLYSHLNEWEQDIVNLFKKRLSKRKTFKISIRKLVKLLGISNASFYNTLKLLHEDFGLRVEKGSHNQGNTYIFMQDIVAMVQEMKAKYSLHLSDILTLLSEELGIDLSRLVNAIASLLNKDSKPPVLDG